MDVLRLNTLFCFDLKGESYSYSYYYYYYHVYGDEVIWKLSYLKCAHSIIEPLGYVPKLPKLQAHCT